MELTSLDLSILMDEFSQLEGGHVQKVYQRGEELSLEIYVPGDEKKRLVVGTDRAFLSDYKRDNPTRPPGFCMELRKHLGRVDSITQRGFDRVLEIESGENRLILEMFGKGNFILTDGDRIIGALREEDWADREIRVGQDYVYPEPTTDPREIDDVLEQIRGGELVRQIASELSFGGTYAEEVLARTRLDKHQSLEDLSREQRESLRSEIESLMDTSEINPRLYLDGEDPVRSSPFHLEKYAENSVREFEKFSEAIDRFYYLNKQLEEKRKREEAYKEKKEGIERQKRQQEMKIRGLRESSEQNREKAERIYENYQKLQQVKRQLENSIDEVGWDRTREKIQESDSEASELVNDLNEQEGFVSVDLKDGSLKVYLYEDLEATASRFYDKAKESEDKIESAKEALEDTEKELEELEKQEIEVEEVMDDKSGKRSKEWFEKYRWFRSSEDFLVLAGRDAQTNDMLVKKHMEPGDLYFHADFDGAPSVVVKDGQDCGEATRKEAAAAAVTFSKTWKAGIGADDVYYVDPDQVTENPESGEYLAKGAFVVRGDREYMRNVSVDAAAGPYEIQEDVYIPVVGPSEAISSLCPDYLELKPGHQKKSEAAKKVNRAFSDYDLDLDYIVRALPPGGSEILE